MGSAQRAAVLWWRNFSATGQLSIPQILSLEFAVFLCFALARIGAEVSAMRRVWVWEWACLLFRDDLSEACISGSGSSPQQQREALRGKSKRKPEV